MECLNLKIEKPLGTMTEVTSNSTIKFILETSGIKWGTLKLDYHRNKIIAGELAKKTSLLHPVKSKLTTEWSLFA